MPRYNVEYNGKYYIFSTIVDSVIETFNSFEELQKYRLVEYGNSEFKNEKSFEELKANKMDFKDMIMAQIIYGNEEKENILKCFNELNDKDKNDVFKSVLEYIKEQRN